MMLKRVIIMGIITGKSSDKLPKQLDYQRAKDLVQELNTFCRQNAKDLGFSLNFSTSNFQYKHFSWESSIVKGTLTIRPQIAQSKVYPVMMSLGNIYRSHETMKHFRSKAKSADTPTPGAQTESECCICFERAPSMMLPCFHSFCPACTEKHIIEKQQKKCPICRTEFHEDNHSLEQRIITVVGEEENFMTDLRAILLEYLKEYSAHEVRAIKRDLQRASRYDSKQAPIQET